MKSRVFRALQYYYRLKYSEYEVINRTTIGTKQSILRIWHEYATNKVTKDDSLFNSF